MSAATELALKKRERTRGDWRFFMLNPPLEGHRFVIVSASVVPYSGPETYIFAADEEGQITGWTELEGSSSGSLDHVQALRDAGYETITELG